MKLTLARSSRPWRRLRCAWRFLGQAAARCKSAGIIAAVESDIPSATGVSRIMKLFKCQACQQILYFENTVCVKSQHRLGFIPDQATLTALLPVGDRWRTVAAAGWEYKFCANAEHGACNWLIEASSPETLCISCRHNRVIPDSHDRLEPRALAEDRDRQAPAILFIVTLQVTDADPRTGAGFRASFRFLGRAPAV
jgi:hypothetical protein